MSRSPSRAEPRRSPSHAGVRAEEVGHRGADQRSRSKPDEFAQFQEFPRTEWTGLQYQFGGCSGKLKVDTSIVPPRLRG